MKTKKILIIIVTIIVIIGIVFGFVKKSGDAILINSHENGAWEYRSFGYKIYNNGVIQAYDNRDEELSARKKKITKDELKKLKELANSVEDEFELDETTRMFDMGVSKMMVYNSKNKSWITLRKAGDNGTGINTTEEGRKIIDFATELYKKYIEK